jgi:uncharacterized protein YdeI (YjbR/CyaY-like superfamily)
MSNPLEMQMFYARDRAAWRAWLEVNHASEPAGVWLVYYKPHAGKPSIDYEASVEEALCFGWIDGLIRRLDDERYARRFTPRKRDSYWAESNRQRVERLIEEGRMMPAGLELVEAARASGRWSEDPRPEVDPAPAPEFRAALAANPRASAFFDSLTPAQQRQYINWMNVAKKPETRARRVAESVALLEQGRKLGMR